MAPPATERTSHSTWTVWPAGTGVLVWIVTLVWPAASASEAPSTETTGAFGPVEPSLTISTPLTCGFSTSWPKAMSTVPSDTVPVHSSIPPLPWPHALTASKSFASVWPSTETSNTRWPTCEVPL